VTGVIWSIMSESDELPVLPTGELFMMVAYPVPRPPESELGNLAPGSWATSSRQDTRFNLCGRGQVLPRGWSGEAVVAIRKVERAVHCKAPADLTLSVIRD